MNELEESAQLDLIVLNASQQNIGEIWIGHQPGGSGYDPQNYHFLAGTNTQVLKPGNTITAGSWVKVNSGGSDKWSAYWRIAGYQLMIGLNSQWFGATIDHQKGSVIIVLNNVGDKLRIWQSQSGSQRGSESIISLLHPETNITTDSYPYSSVWAGQDADPISIDKMLGISGQSLPDYVGKTGVCLSGGGSRAMIAGLGQLQALDNLTYEGNSILSRMRAVSSVSGGSWIASTYTHLADPNISDQDFLGLYVEPQNLIRDPDTVEPENICSLGEHELGNVCQNKFSAYRIGLEIGLLVWADAKSGFKKIRWSQVWQELIGRHILSPYGLYRQDYRGSPATTFAYNQQQVDMYGDNTSMRPFHFYADNTQNADNRGRRPVWICSMALEAKDDQNNTFATALSGTAFYTGAFGHDANLDNELGAPVGLGSIASFAFSSNPNPLSQKPGYPPDPKYWYSAKQPRQWALSDCVGVSSAAIAAIIWVVLDKLSAQEIAELVQEFGPSIAEDARQYYGAETASIIEREIEALSDVELPEAFTNHPLIVFLVGIIKSRGGSFVPQYPYWSPEWYYFNEHYMDALPKQLLNQFADGGVLDNSGLAALLAYNDIDTAIAFINSKNKLEIGAHGIQIDGEEIPNTNIIVDSQIPPLFGFAPYDPDTGYIQEFPNTFEGRSQQRVQIFKSRYFEHLLKNLWTSTGSTLDVMEENFQKFPFYLQTDIKTVKNKIFKVKEDRIVDVIWFYLNPCSDWYNLLDQQVKNAVDECGNFPNYGTSDTGLSKIQVNLLQNLTAWAVRERQPAIDQFINRNKSSKGK